MGFPRAQTMGSPTLVDVARGHTGIEAGAGTAHTPAMAKPRKPPARAAAAPLDQITAHFRLAEFNCPDGTAVPSAAHAALKRLCETFLEPMREQFGVAKVISGFRTDRHNAKIGGPSDSIHLYALDPQQVAADVRFETGTPADWAAFAESLKSPGIGRFDDSRYIHVDNRKGAAARWEGAVKDPPPPRAGPRRQKLDQITPHFRVAEFDCHDGRPVPVEAHDAVLRLCEQYLEKMRAKFGPAQVLSGFRPRDYNERIDGAKKSMHIYDEHPDQVAADTRYARGTPAAWARYAESLGAGGVGQYDQSRFVHIDNRINGPARWSQFQG
jgi:uncharacterized protein YcbK (DUF882 family)